MVLKSGLKKVDVDGKTDYLDSVEEFKKLIEGELLFKVLDHSKNKYKRGMLSSGGYKITADNNKNTLRILYESTDREEGIEYLNYLSNMLIERYEKRLKYLRDNYEYELMIAKRQLEFSIDEKKFITSRLIDIQKRLDRYTQEIGPLNSSYESHSKFQSRLLTYSSIIDNVANLKRKNAQAGWQIDFYNKEIADLKKEKPSKQAILVAQPPTAGQHPIKLQKKLIVISATFIGLSLMVFLSFLLEYISKHKIQKASNVSARY
jgi:hypothetical protein